jgi:hypothetical protein
LRIKQEEAWELKGVARHVAFLVVENFQFKMGSVTPMELIGRSAVILVALTGLLVAESATGMELRGKNTNEVKTIRRNLPM